MIRLPWYSEGVAPLLSRLHDIILSKKSILCVAADVTTCAQLVALIHQTGPHICILKTHVDILEDFQPSILDILRQLSEEYEFLIFEDRKFADIGHTVTLQYDKGIYKISYWAHFINCHLLPGPGIIDALSSIGLPLNRGLLIISDMSSQGWLGDQAYKDACLQIALTNKNFVLGWISQERWSKDLPGVVMTPGISITSKGDHLGQQYSSPEDAIRRGSDIIIVGRAIINHTNPGKTAETYKLKSWAVYCGHYGIQDTTVR